MLVFLLFLHAVIGKQVSTKFRFDEQNPWKYLTKFAVGVGNANWELNVTVVDPVDPASKERIRPTLVIYLDDQLEEISSIPDCEGKLAISKKTQNFSVSYNGEHTYIKGTFTQKSRPHVWYYVLADCKGSSKGAKLKVNIHLTGTDNSEFSIEEEGLVYLYPIVTVIFFFSLFQNLKRMINRFQKTEKLDKISLILNLSIFCEFSGMVTKIIHLWIYSINGKGIFIVNFLSQSFEMVSSLIVTIMFIVIAKGWILKHKELPRAEVIIPIALVVLVANVLIILFGGMTDDSHNKFSDYESTAGLMLILLRVALWCWFLYLIWILYTSQQNKESTLSFIINFAFIASAYFLALPLLVVGSTMFKNYLRSKLVSLGSEVIQIIVFIFLTHLFGNTSSFYKISTLSHSDLPGKSH